MATKGGDPINQKLLLGETERIPPSPAQVKQTLRDIGVPQYEMTGTLLTNNGLSLTPVDKPKRQARLPQPVEPTSIFAQASTGDEPDETASSLGGPARYLRDCCYCVAVQGGGHLLWAAFISITTGASFWACVQFDVFEKFARLRGQPQVIQEEARQIPSPPPSPIETGSLPTPRPLPPPPAAEIGPWDTRTDR